LTRAAEQGGAAKVVSCFAHSETARDEFSAKHGVSAASSLEAMLDDQSVEGVLIATSHQSHRPLVEQAAAAGKHVFVEKPLTTRVAEGRACVEAARAAGVLLQVGHQRRRTAANRRLKEMLGYGELGDVETVIAHQSVPNGFKLPETAWRWDPEQSPLGGMTSLGVHKIDTMHYLVGPIARVSAFTRSGREDPIDEATVLALEFESGALATLTTSFYTPVANDIAVFATLGAAYNAMGGAKLGVQMRDDPAPEPVELPEIDPVVDELVGFAKAIRGEGPVEPTGKQVLQWSPSSRQPWRAPNPAEPWRWPGSCLRPLPPCLVCPPSQLCQQGVGQRTSWPHWSDPGPPVTSASETRPNSPTEKCQPRPISPYGKARRPEAFDRLTQDQRPVDRRGAGRRGRMSRPHDGPRLGLPRGCRPCPRPALGQFDPRGSFGGASGQCPGSRLRCRPPSRRSQ